MMKQIYSDDALDTVLCLKGTNVFRRGERVWRMMSVLISHKRSELNARSKKLECWCVPPLSIDRRSRSSNRDQPWEGTCRKILFDDLNISRITQHSVPHVLTQDQPEDRIFGDQIIGADEDTMFLNRIITGDESWSFL